MNKHPKQRFIDENRTFHSADDFPNTLNSCENGYGIAKMLHAVMKGAESPIDPLPKEEWDFSACPDWQVDVCFFYECCREDEKYYWNQVSIRQRNRTIERMGLSKVYDHPFHAYCEFPRLPWLAIPQWKIRRRLLKDHGSPADYLSFMKDRGFGNGKIEYLFENGAYQSSRLIFTDDLDEITVGVYKIEWKYPDSVLRDAFSRHLKIFRPQKPRIKTGSTTSREQLKQLGAYRLMKHCRGNWKLAAQMSQNALAADPDAKPLYEYQSGWDRAVQATRKRLAVEK